MDFWSKHPAAAIGAVAAVVIIITLLVAVRNLSLIPRSALEGIWESDGSKKVVWFIDKPNADGNHPGWIYEETEQGDVTANKAAMFTIRASWLDWVGQPGVIIGADGADPQRYVVDLSGPGTLTSASITLRRNAVATAAALETEDYVDNVPI